MCLPPAWCLPCPVRCCTQRTPSRCQRRERSPRRTCLAFGNVRRSGQFMNVLRASAGNVSSLVYTVSGAHTSPADDSERQVSGTDATTAARPSVDQQTIELAEETLSRRASDAYQVITVSAEAPTNSDSTPPECSDQESRPARRRRRQTPSLTRAATMRARWADPVIRTRMLQSRQSKEILGKQAAAMAKRWQDPAFRTRIQQALKGRRAWNQGKQLPSATRERIRTTMLRQWAKRKERVFPEAAHPVQDPSGESAYQRLARQFRALAADLRIWSDGFYVQTGRRPRATDIEAADVAHAPQRGGRDRALRVMTPALIFKCRRFLELKRWLQDYDATLSASGEEIIRDDIDARK
ncbi:hypothetical protein F1559_002996 [Cyanidiococcus yangmingshanensis]|uniref:Uncharacterized protein n=1 Tax=Cyanidiococcus yangmingshanensis TaxID=2690220 RepID=A0A7J7IIU8_9RHOD|nr:hypothetical protein F1559_002996 [Cyanidiococcus yangmingshanensis]